MMRFLKIIYRNNRFNHARLSCGCWSIHQKSKYRKRKIQITREKAPIITLNGQAFKDLNKNGKVDPYEDFRNPVETRVEDLLSQMNLEEKAGLMFITMIGMTQQGEHLDLPPLQLDPMNWLFYSILDDNATLIIDKKMNHFNIINSYTPDVLARFNNHLQEKAERGRLGIRNHCYRPKAWK